MKRLLGLDGDGQDIAALYGGAAIEDRFGPIVIATSEAELQFWHAPILEVCPVPRCPPRSTALRLGNGRRRLGQMRTSTFKKRVVRIAHCFGSGLAEHNLEIDRLEAVVLIAVDDAGRAGDAFPRAEPLRKALAGFVLDEDIEMTLAEITAHEEECKRLLAGLAEKQSAAAHRRRPP